MKPLGNGKRLAVDGMIAIEYNPMLVNVEPGWQKLHGSTGGTRRKVWTQTKILSPNIRYFVAN